MAREPDRKTAGTAAKGVGAIGGPAEVGRPGGTSAGAGSPDPVGGDAAGEVDLLPGSGAPAGWRYNLRAIGPGLITGASDDDPSGVATYSQAGASQGFGLLWTSLLTFPLMTAVQEICDRTALATGRSLGALVGQRWPGRIAKPVVGTLLAGLVAANGLNIAADLVAVGSGMTLLHAGPTWLWALLAGVTVTALVMFGSFVRIAAVFKILCAALLLYFVVAIMLRPSLSQVLGGLLLPRLHLDKSYLTLLVAVLGTTISPYLFFWQSTHRLEEMKAEPLQGRRAVPLADREPASARRKQRSARLDVIVGMAFSNLVMFAIIVSTAATLHVHGHLDLNSAADAAQALQPLAGRWAEALFAFGFIGSGMLALPVLAGSGAAGMAGLVGKTYGFSRSVRHAPLFYLLVGVGTIGGTVLTLVRLDPVQLLVISAYINGIAAAPFLAIVMLISGSRRIMGDHANGRLATTLGWATTILMTAAAVTSLVL